MSGLCWGFCTGGIFWQFCPFYNVEIRPVDLKSFISVTHLVHIAGPLHDVLEGSLTRDIIHQEDSLKRDLM